MTREQPGLIAAVLLVSGLMTGAAAIQHAREQRYPLSVVGQEYLFISSGQALRRITTGYRALAADLYWIRAIQHYGQTRIRLTTPLPPGSPPYRRDGYELLFPLLDLTTTLDPYFTIAYRFGSVFLSAPLPNGAGRPELAVALLEKGLQESPRKWEFLHDIGFVYYWELHDYPKAAASFNRAAALPGAPWWLGPIAATTLARGGDRGASRLLWRQLYESAPDDIGRQAAELKLRQLDALDQIEALQKRVDSFIQGRGEPPASWQTLVAAGELAAIPLDPGGTPYELAGSGRVVLSMRSTLFPLPVEPGPRRGAP